MRALVHRYLARRLSRRGFVNQMARWGFSAAATASILESLEPLARAQPAPAGAGTGAAAAAAGERVVEGTGGELLVEQLRAAGVRFLFNCNSSGTFAVFDALVGRSDVQVIQAPQEGQTVAIAQGYALASGDVAFALSGSVGFPNTLNNLYNAWKDRTPLVVAAQREATAEQGGRDAFEEWDDYLSPSASFTRWRWSVDRAERIPEITRRAFKIASTPPGGPVALALPSDALAAAGVKSAVIPRERFILRPRVRPSPGLVEEAAKLLVAARSPMLVVGPEVTRAGAKEEVVRLAEQLAIPVAEGEDLFDDFPTGHPLFVGNFGPRLRVGAPCDVVVSLGARLSGEEGALPPGAKVVHVSIDPETIGRVVPTDVGMVADVKDAALDLHEAIASVATAARLDALRSARFPVVESFSGQQRAAQERATRARWNALPLSWERVIGELASVLDTDAVLVPELAQNTWSNQPWRWEAQFTFAPGGRSKIGRTTGSALGWGIGAAIGVKLAWPDRQVVALQGDGGFLFAQTETLWTMARYEVPVLVVILNNRSYNGPRNKVLMAGGRQARAGADMTCYLGSPDVDFAKIAAGFGVAGETVDKPGQLQEALRRAVASTREGRPYLIDAVIGRTGRGAESTWFPAYSVAAARTRRV